MQGDNSPGVELSQQSLSSLSYESVQRLSHVATYPSARRLSFTATPTQPLIERDISQNKYTNTEIFQILKELCSTNVYRFPCPLYDRLMEATCPPVCNLQDSFDLERAIAFIIPNITTNNPETLNFNQLVLFLLTHLKRMRNQGYRGEWPIDAYNALFCVYAFSKYIMTQDSGSVQHLFEMDQHQADSTKSPLNVRRNSNLILVSELDLQIVADKRQRSVLLMEELIQALIYANLESVMNYNFYIEIIRVLLDRTTSRHHFVEIWLQMPHFSKGLLHRLMLNVAENPKPPQQSVFFSFFFSNHQSEHSLADASVHFLGVLSQQNSCLYKCILELKDDSSKEDELARISFKLIFDQITSNMNDSYLLLFSILFENPNFKKYCLSRLDPEVLLLALCGHVYHLLAAPLFPSLYMVCTIFLELAKDGNYVETMHKIAIAKPIWLTERITSLSLGDLFILTNLRLVQMNFRYKDLFIHSMLCGILYFLGKKATNVSVYVSQKLTNIYMQHLKRIGLPGHMDMLCGLLEFMYGAMMRATQNSTLIYALLQSPNMFTIDIEGDERITPLCQRLFNQLGFIQSRLKQLEMEDIISTISSTTLTLEPLDPIEFEISIPQGTYLAHAWVLVYTYSGIYWDAELVLPITNE